MVPRLVAIDIDGTLLSSDGHVSPRNREALLAAERAGMQVVIATGRRHSYAMRVLRELGLGHANALVSSNGTVIRTLNADLIHRHHLPTATARWLCGHVSEFRRTLVLTFDLVGSSGEDSRGALVVEDMDELNASIDLWMQANEPSIAHVDPLEDALQGEPPIQMMLCGTVARMRAAEARLLESPHILPVGAVHGTPDTVVTLHRTEYPDRDLSILDILPAGVSKASALQHLGKLQGFAPEDILAIGDNWNDVPMLELAGRAVLMSNAPDDLKELAAECGWTVGASNDEDGVAVALEPFLAAAAVPPAD